MFSLLWPSTISGQRLRSHKACNTVKNNNKKKSEYLGRDGEVQPWTSKEDRRGRATIAVASSEGQLPQNSQGMRPGRGRRGQSTVLHEAKEGNSEGCEGEGVQTPLGKAGLTWQPGGRERFRGECTQAHTWLGCSAVHLKSTTVSWLLKYKTKQLKFKNSLKLIFL